MSSPAAPSPTERFLPSLLEGDTDETYALFNENGDVDDPLNGRVGEPGFYIWAAARHLWLRGYQAVLEPVRTTRAGTRCCVELVIQLGDYKGKKVALPVAVIGEEAGDKLVRARIYHSLWPLYGQHQIRPPTLEPDPGLELAPGDPVAVYQAALARGDVEGVLAALEEDAVVREPSGGEYTHAGREAQRKLYTAMLADGGIPLIHNAVVDDGEACALEYTVDRWGKAALVPQPGVAVYLRGPRGKLAAARIYDDVQPPAG